MQKTIFFLCLLFATGVTAGGESSLVWMEELDVPRRLESTIHRNLGVYSIVELPQSALSSLKNEEVHYEILDPTSGEEEYWLVWDFQIQGFAPLSTMVEILKIHDNAAIIQGERKVVEEQVPALGFELEKLFRQPRREPRSPLLGKGGLGGVLQEVSADSIESYIRWLESYDTRYTYTLQCTLSAQGLYDKFQNYGLQVEYFHFPYGLNVVATLPGDETPDVVYIIGGHYDSTSDRPYFLAPGADDNASGTAAVIEAARVLRHYVPGATVKFICFGAEEQGLHGSWYYARYADSIGLDIRGVLNFDMIAYCDIEDYFDLRVVTNENSEPIADLLIDAGQDLPALVLVKTMGGGGSDHASFWQWGYPAIMGIERASDHWNPYYHSTADTTGTLTIPFAAEVVKLGVAGLLGLAKFFPYLSLHNSEWLDSGGDGQANPGDTLALTVTLLNSGRDASAVSVSLHSDNPLVTVIDSSSDYGEMLSDSMDDNGGDPFLFRINDAACSQVCTFDLAITADTFDFSGMISVMVEPVFAAGDCNGDSCINVLDVSYLSDYVSHGGPAPLGSGDLNLDGSVDTSDPIYLLSLLFDGGSPPCGEIPLLCVEAPSPGDTVEIGDAVVCCTTTTLSAPITLKNSSAVAGMTVALRYDTSSVVCDSVALNNGLFEGWSQEIRIDEASGTILAAVWTPSLLSPDQLSPGTWDAASLWFSSLISSDGQDTVTTVDTLFIQPNHRLSLIDLSYLPMSPAFASGTIAIAPQCGDANQDCRLTVADAIAIVDHVYGGAPAPVCEADVNTDDRIAVADANYIVSYIYRGGPAPCNPPVSTPFRQRRRITR